MAQVFACNLKVGNIPANDDGHREQVIFVSIKKGSACRGVKSLPPCFTLLVRREIKSGLYWPC